MIKEFSSFLNETRIYGELVPVKHDGSNVKVGDEVRHQDYGEGVVKNIREQFGVKVIKVHFLYVVPGGETREIRADTERDFEVVETPDFIEVEGDVRDYIKPGDIVQHITYGNCIVLSVRLTRPLVDLKVISTNVSREIRTDLGVLKIRNSSMEKPKQPRRRIRWYDHGKLDNEWIT